MFRISSTLASLMVLFFATAGTAQEPPAAPPATTQPADKHNVRRYRPEDPSTLGIRLNEELHLDQSQQEAIAKVLKDHQTYVNEIRQSMQELPTDGHEKMRALTDEMRAAREAGDMDKVRVLSEQIREIGKEQQSRLAPLRQKMMESQEKLKVELSAVLREEQKARFETYWTERMARRSPYRGPERSPQTLKTLVDRLPAVTTEQRQQIDGLFRQHQDAEKATEKGSAAERALVTKLYDGVMASLTPEQRMHLERQLNGQRSSARGADTPPPTAGEPHQRPQPKSPEQPATP